MATFDNITTDTDVTEAGGITNGAPGDTGADGQLTITAGATTFTGTSSLVGTYGTFTFDLLDGTWTYTLDDNNGATEALTQGEGVTDTLTVTADDLSTYDIVINVTGANDTPTFTVVGGSDNDVTETGDVAGDGAAGGQILISDVDAGEGVFVTNGPVAATYGTFNFDAATGNWSYTLDDARAATQNLVTGQSPTDSMIVSTADGTAYQIDVVVHGSDDSAVVTASGGEDLAVLEAGGVANGTAGDASAGGQLFVSDMDLGQAAFTTNGVVSGIYGDFIFNSGSGNWTYTLDDSRLATQSLVDGEVVTDTMTVSTVDGTTYDVDVTVTGANDAPVLTVTSLGTINDTAADDNFADVTGTVAATDPDAGDTQTYSLSGGLVSLEPGFDVEQAGAYGTLYLDSATGNYKFVPDDAAVEALTGPVSESFDIVVTDGLGGTDTQTFSVAINGANDTAVITPSGAEDNAVLEAGGVSNGTAGDATAGGQLFVTDADTGEGNFVTDGIVAGTYGDFTFTAATGVWSYTLDDSRAATQSLVAGEPGTDTLIVTTTDGTTYNVVVNVTGANDTPSLAVIGTTTYTDTAADDSFTDIVGTLTPTDADAGETFTYTLTEGGPDNSLAGYDQSVGTGYGQLYLNGTTGDYTFVVNDAGVEGLTGNTSGTFHFEVTDSQGASSIQSIQIDFVGAQDAAVIGGAVSGNVTEDAAATLTAAGALTVADRDDSESVFQVQNGTAGNNGYGSFDLAADGSWTYTADNTQAAIQQLAAGATLTDSFTALSADGTSQVVTVTITGVNDVAVIGGATSGAANEDDAATLTASGALTVSDVDTGEESFQVQAGTAGSNGLGSFNLDAAGNWTYAADNSQAAIQQLSAGDTLTDSFTALAADGTSQVVTVTITGTNDNPVATDDNAATDDSSSVQIDVLGNDSDVDANDTLTVTDAQVLSGGGTVSIALDGSSVTFDPGSDYSYLGAGETATVTIGYTVDDGNGGTADAEVTVTVTGGNEAPVILPATEALAFVNELADGNADENNFSHGVSGTIHFSDADATDTHSASFVAQGAGYLGQFSLDASVNDADGTLGWSFSVDDSALNGLAQGEVLRQFYTVTLDDGQGGTVEQVIEVDLVGTNDRAVVSSVNDIVQQGDDPVTAGGQLTITDEDGPAAFQPQVSTAGQYGHFTVDAAGNWSYVADQAYSLARNEYLSDVFTVQAADGTPTTVAVTIAGVDRPAVGHQDLFTTAENAAFGAGFNLFADNGYGADVDPDSPLQISAVNGQVGAVGHTIVLASGALVTVNADGTFRYDPNHAFDSLTAANGAANQFGFDSFTYTLAGGSTTTAFVNVLGVNSATDILSGSGLDNAVTGFASNDTFMLNQGGSDSANGLGGDDGFFFGGFFDSTDGVDGGTGNDTLALQGNTVASLGGVSNVEVITALSGSDTRFGDTGNHQYSYDLTTADSTVGAGQTLTLAATGLLAGENMKFDGSAETDGNFRIFAGQGADDLRGGGGSDGFFFGADGNLTGADHVDGGAGVDTLALRGNYVGGTAVVFQDGSFGNVEVLALLSGHSNEFSGQIVPTGFDYDVTIADGNVAAGQRLDVNGARLGADETMVFNGSAETDGSFRILGGAANDTLTGGAQSDTLYGSAGADHLNGGAGADVFTYRSAVESTSTGYDVITGFDYREDRLDLPGGGARAFTQAGAGSLSTASFDADLAAGLDGILGAGQAALFTANGGTLSGHVFAVVDANGVAGYQAGEDFVIELANPAVAIDPHATVIG